MPLALKIVDGPDSLGKVIPLLKEVTSCGRSSPPCDIQLKSNKVSKHHCDFEIKNGQLFVTDKKSANGIFLNGGKVESSSLTARDRMVIGEFVIEVVVE